MNQMSLRVVQTSAAQLEVRKRELQSRCRELQEIGVKVIETLTQELKQLEEWKNPLERGQANQEIETNEKSQSQLKFMLLDLFQNLKNKVTCKTSSKIESLKEDLIEKAKGLTIEEIKQKAGIQGDDALEEGLVEKCKEQINFLRLISIDLTPEEYMKRSQVYLDL